jgi:hypothetical protein
VQALLVLDVVVEDGLPLGALDRERHRDVAPGAGGRLGQPQRVAVLGDHQPPGERRGRRGAGVVAAAVTGLVAGPVAGPATGVLVVVGHRLVGHRADGVADAERGREDDPEADEERGDPDGCAERAHVSW